MNSLNLLSSRVIGQSAHTTRPRSRSQGQALRTEDNEGQERGRSHSDGEIINAESDMSLPPPDTALFSKQDNITSRDTFDEKQPLLNTHKEERGAWPSKWRRVFKRIIDALTAVLSAIGAPVMYLARYFHREDRRLQAIPRLPGRRHSTTSNIANTAGQPHPAEDNPWLSEKPTNRVLQETRLRHSYSSD